VRHNVSDNVSDRPDTIWEGNPAQHDPGTGAGAVTARADRQVDVDAQSGTDEQKGGTT
jgi:hypothetical protein